MGFIGFAQGPSARICFMTFAVICGCTFFLQLRFLRKLKIFSVYLLPILSFCMCYENVILYMSDHIDGSSNVAAAGKVFQSLQIPLFVLILFEVPCRLHEARSVQFFLVPFDQEKEVSKLPGELIISTMRLFAIGAFVINIFVNFSNICEKQNDNDFECSLPLRGGYVTLGFHPHNISLWMALAVPSYLFLVAFNMYISLHRYGKNATLSLTSTAPWTVLGITSICQIIGQIFGLDIYPVTSNAGELLLLLGVSWIVYLVQKDLAITRDFADFLFRSNVAFQDLPPVVDTHQHGHLHPGHKVHHHHGHHHDNDALDKQTTVELSSQQQTTDKVTGGSDVNDIEKNVTAIVSESANVNANNIGNPELNQVNDNDSKLEVVADSSNQSNL